MLLLLHGVSLRLVLLVLVGGASRRLLVPGSSLGGRLLLLLLLGEKGVGLLRCELGVLDVGLGGAILASRKLAPVHLIVLLLQLAHLLDFVEVDDEARLKIVQIFDAFATKY